MATAAHPAPSAHPASHWSAGRVVAIVLGSLGALIGAALLLGGLAIVLAHLTLRDSDGFFTSSTERVATSTRALTSDGLRIGRIDGPGADWAADAAPVRVRVRATGADGRPLFVGIAPERTVDAYLRGVAHDEVTDVHDRPFSLETIRRAGDARPAPPASRDIWAASASGGGTQNLTWNVDEGNWAVVVMNADGRRGIAADVSVGARLGWLVWVGVGLAAFGLLSIAGGGALLFAGLRSRRGDGDGPGAAAVGATATGAPAAGAVPHAEAGPIEAARP